MFNLDKVSKNLENFNDYENIEINFSKSIEFNPKLDFEIKKVYHRTLNNNAKFVLGCFHLNIFDTLESIVGNTNESDDFILDLSEFIANYFDDANSNLNIKNLRDFKEFLFDLKLASIILNTAFEENDMELIYESFYQLKSRFEKNHLINNYSLFNKLSTEYDIFDVGYEIQDDKNVIMMDNFPFSVEDSVGGK
ncbi:hypothetical protein [uncultured Methanobrevibacter sp.]|uniref:hypothetical protein n=1 Tax=uncultured Methanobrevibacter sp. TaxID=253161 RepID=UPI0025DFBDDF|nr:hypothetical protein [uncultured Methanobrevibacter sp.]